eukprot:TRINITY_DN56256_c0_g1_i1.p1 TRINITY_DN56256_c0_g1~~TRINITY_DN56256_c0_g1_i1.p1  ORF type:complete len:1323 (-),score=239.11 TRINITY_DN56256_c0_g1_i1:68-4036(-)
MELQFGKAAVAVTRDVPPGKRSAEQLVVIGKFVQNTQHFADGFFASFSPSGLSELFQRFEYRRVDAGVAVFTKGSKATQIYVIGTGHVNIVHEVATDEKDGLDSDACRDTDACKPSDEDGLLGMDFQAQSQQTSGFAHRGSRLLSLKLGTFDDCEARPDRALSWDPVQLGSVGGIGDGSAGYAGSGIGGDGAEADSGAELVAHGDDAAAMRSAAGSRASRTSKTSLPRRSPSLGRPLSGNTVGDGNDESCSDSQWEEAGSPWGSMREGRPSNEARCDSLLVRMTRSATTDSFVATADGSHVSFDGGVLTPQDARLGAPVISFMKCLAERKKADASNARQALVDGDVSDDSKDEPFSASFDAFGKLIDEHFHGQTARDGDFRRKSRKAVLVNLAGEDKRSPGDSPRPKVNQTTLVSPRSEEQESRHTKRSARIERQRSKVDSVLQCVIRDGDSIEAKPSHTGVLPVGSLLGAKACLSCSSYDATALSVEVTELLCLSEKDLREVFDLEKRSRHRHQEAALLAALNISWTNERERIGRLSECFRQSQHRRGTVLCWEGEQRAPQSENDRLQVVISGRARLVKFVDRISSARAASVPVTKDPALTRSRAVACKQAHSVFASKPLRETRDFGFLLPGHVVNGTSQLQGSAEPFTVFVDTAEAVVACVAHGDLHRLQQLGVLEGLRASVDEISRWHTQRLEKLEDNAKQQNADDVPAIDQLQHPPEKVVHTCGPGGRSLMARDIIRQVLVWRRRQRHAAPGMLEIPDPRPETASPQPLPSTLVKSQGSVAVEKRSFPGHASTPREATPAVAVAVGFQAEKKDRFSTREKPVRSRNRPNVDLARLPDETPAKAPPAGCPSRPKLALAALAARRSSLNASGKRRSNLNVGSIVMEEENESSEGSPRLKASPSVADSILVSDWSLGGGSCTSSLQMRNLSLNQGSQTHCASTLTESCAARTPSVLLSSSLAQLKRREQGKLATEPSHLVRLEMRGDQAIVVGTGPIVPMTIGSLQNSNHQELRPATSPTVATLRVAASKASTRFAKTAPVGGRAPPGKDGVVTRPRRRLVTASPVPAPNWMLDDHAITSEETSHFRDLEKTLLPVLTPTKAQLDDLSIAWGLVEDLHLSQTGLDGSTDSRSFADESTAVDEASVWDRFCSMMSLTPSQDDSALLSRTLTAPSCQSNRFSQMLDFCSRGSSREFDEDSPWLFPPTPQRPLENTSRGTCTGSDVSRPAPMRLQCLDASSVADAAATSVSSAAAAVTTVRPRPPALGSTVRRRPVVAAARRDAEIFELLNVVSIDKFISKEPSRGCGGPVAGSKRMLGRRVFQ